MWGKSRLSKGFLAKEKDDVCSTKVEATSLIKSSSSHNSNFLVCECRFEAEDGDIL